MTRAREREIGRQMERGERGERDRKRKSVEREMHCARAAFDRNVQIAKHQLKSHKIFRKLPLSIVSQRGLLLGETAE